MPLTPQAHRSAASSHPDNQQQPAAASDAISEHDQVLLYLQQLLSNPPTAPPGTVPNLLGVTITIRQQDLEPAWAPSLPGGLSFKLQDFIGKGGFGAVYRAVSDSLPVAAPQSNLGIPQHLSSAAMATYGSFSGISGLAPTAAAGTGCNNSSSSSSRNTAYAVKVCLEPAQHEAWEREVRVLQKLGHVPGCLQLLGQATLVSTTGTALQYMVTPLHLGSLTQLLQAYVKQFGRSLHVSTIQDIIKQLLTILHKLHSGACGGHVILHLDIKASNILLDLVKGRWIVTLADYGISNAVVDVLGGPNPQFPLVKLPCENILKNALDWVVAGGGPTGGAGGAPGQQVPDPAAAAAAAFAGL
jgi:serine/threonine protein kinase